MDVAALAAKVPDALVRLAPPALSPSVHWGAFESSMHRRWDGARLDMIAATRHDVFAEADYRRLGEAGMTACRDAVRWPLVEADPGRLDLATFLPMVHAAKRVGVRVIWDLCHYGWPDGLDVFSGAFVRHFAALGRRVAEVLDDALGEVWISPVNEISFLSWAAGERQLFHPYASRRGGEMKENLVRAACAAMDAILARCPRARFLHCDPVIHLVARTPEAEAGVATYRAYQFEAWDWIAGRERRHLGGDPRFLDIVGVNYYRNNQTFEDGSFIGGDDPAYRPFSHLLLEVWRRYRRPMVIAETGIEDDLRPDWLRYVAGEVGLAMDAGCALHAIVWSPIVNHPGWDDGRHCHNGLWDYADAAGHRPVHPPLLDAMDAVAPSLARLRAKALVAAGPALAPETPRAEDTPADAGTL